MDIPAILTAAAQAGVVITVLVFGFVVGLFMIRSIVSALMATNKDLIKALDRQTAVLRYEQRNLYNELKEMKQELREERHFWQEQIDSSQDMVITAIRDAVKGRITDTDETNIIQR